MRNHIVNVVAVLVMGAVVQSALVTGIQQKIAAGFLQPATQAKLVALDSTVVASMPHTFPVFPAADLEK